MYVAQWLVWAVQQVTRWAAAELCGRDEANFHLNSWKLVTVSACDWVANGWQLNEIVHWNVTSTEADREESSNVAVVRRSDSSKITQLMKNVPRIVQRVNIPIFLSPIYNP